MALNMRASTLDDLMRQAIASVLNRGTRIEPTKGAAIDLSGVRLELTNPLARLSRSEARGRIFSCLGELCWYLAGSDSTEWISYYISQYRNYDENGIIHGSYGPRLRGYGHGNQIDYVIRQLTRNPHSRKAVIQIFDSEDVLNNHKDIPCTCTLQFLVRDSSLHLVSYMRSNDIYLGLPHDIFSFSMIQELVARSLNVHLGTYVHMVGSLHAYDRDRDQLSGFIDEGWQSSTAMPAMPPGDQWANVERLLELEGYLRAGGDPHNAPEIDNPYWSDLGLILAMFALDKQGSSPDIPTLMSKVSTPVYNVFLDDRRDKRR